jgi:hypothetical protein
VQEAQLGFFGGTPICPARATATLGDTVVFTDVQWFGCAGVGGASPTAGRGGCQHVFQSHDERAPAVAVLGAGDLVRGIEMSLLVSLLARVGGRRGW